MSYECPLLSTLRAELSRPTPVIHVLIGPRQWGGLWKMPSARIYAQPPFCGI